jgi:hypothetical protein
LINRSVNRFTSEENINMVKDNVRRTKLIGIIRIFKVTKGKMQRLPGGVLKTDHSVVVRDNLWSHQFNSTVVQ